MAVSANLRDALEIALATQNNSDEMINLIEGGHAHSGGILNSVQMNNGSGGFTGDAQFIYVGGNLGIGTDVPDGRLHVMKASAGVVTASGDGDALVVENSDVAGMTFLSPNDGNIYFGDVADNDIGRIIYNHSTDSMRLWTNNAERVRIDSAGKVGIGVIDPDTQLEVLGATTQLKLSYDASNAVKLTAASNGDLSITNVTTLDRKFTKTTSEDGNYDGDVAYIGTGASVLGQLYYFNGTDWVHTDANTASSAASKGLLGIALGTDTDVHGMLLRGMVTLDHDPGAAGDVLYISGTAGQATGTAPAVSGDTVRIIGYCLDASDGQIWFNPDGTYVELA